MLKLLLSFLLSILLWLNSYCPLVGQIEALDRQGKDFALFFAVDDYGINPNLNNLQNPINDAKQIAQLLNERYGFITRVVENPTLEQIEDLLILLQKRHFEEGSQLFIFFSGHGQFRKLSNQGYFIPNDGQVDNYGSYLNLIALGNIVTQIPCDHILLAIDACYSGTILQPVSFRGSGFKRPTETDRVVKARFITSELNSNSRLVITSGGVERTPDPSHFSKAILAGLNEAAETDFGLLSYLDLLSKLEKVSPTPRYGTLFGQEKGGFVFLPLENLPPPETDKLDRDPIFDVSEKSKGGTERTTSDNKVSDPKLSTTSKREIVFDQDGNQYPVLAIPNGRLWLGENLSFKVDDSSCYDDNPINCKPYGRLYSWEAAQEACEGLGPAWGLPSDKDWKKLAASAGGYHDWGPDRKEVGSAQDGFIALKKQLDISLVGYQDVNSGYLDNEINSEFWTSSARQPEGAWRYFFSGRSERLERNHGEKKDGRSVRCIKDSLRFRKSLTKDESSIIDPQGNYYKVVLLRDGKAWLGQNLNLEVPESYCYDHDNNLCKHFGRLYTWSAAAKGCQTLGKNWRLPTLEEWQDLYDLSGGNHVAAFKQLTLAGTRNFEAQFGGYRSEQGRFTNRSVNGRYWSATSKDEVQAHTGSLTNFTAASSFLLSSQNKQRGLSVRCVKEE